MKIQKYRKKAILILLFPVGMLLFHLTTLIPDFVENYFSKGINKWFIELLSLLTGIVPFSIAEAGLILLSFLALLLIILGGIRLIRLKSGRLKCLLNYIVNILAAVSLVYFVLTVTWTLNYNRLPYAKIAGLDIRPASVDELAGLCDSLISRANSLKDTVHTDSNGIMVLSGSISETFSRAKLGYGKAAITTPELSGTYGRPKYVIFFEIHVIFRHNRAILPIYLRSEY